MTDQQIDEKKDFREEFLGDSELMNLIKSCFNTTEFNAWYENRYCFRIRDCSEKNKGELLRWDISTNSYSQFRKMLIKKIKEYGIHQYKD